MRQIIAVVFQFILLSAYSQENFVPGRIIDLNGDTVRGYIDYRNWDKNPKTIFFRKDINGISNSYNPLDIRGFMVQDELYESAIVEIETSPVLTARLKPDPELYFAKDTAFLQAMIRGSKSLYFLKDKTGKLHFYIQDSTFSLLIYKRYFKVVEGRNGVAENRNYLGQLINYLGDCPDIQKKIENTGYNKLSLEKLFTDYYSTINRSNYKNRSNTGITFQKKTEKLKAEIGIIAGMTSTGITFRSATHEYLSKADFKSSSNFSFGMFFDIILPRQQGKWSVLNELTFTEYLNTGKYYDFETNEKNTMNYTTVGFSYINLNNMVRFKYPVKMFHIFANAGVSNGLKLSGENIRKQEIKYYTEEITKYSYAVKDIRNIEQKFNLGMGARFKHMSLEFRYEVGNGVAKALKLTSTTKRYYFILGYRF